MKAVLIIDMPKDCYECPCICDEFNSCQANNNRQMGWNQKGIPLWCPLKPLPNKKHDDENDMEEACYMDGWNACIDEIIGETDDRK